MKIVAVIFVIIAFIIAASGGDDTAFLFFGFIALCVGTFIYHSYKAHKENYVSTSMEKKLLLERVALKNEYRAKVPTRKNGVHYTSHDQARDQVGVYSKEYWKENQKLTEKYYGKKEVWEEE